MFFVNGGFLVSMLRILCLEEQDTKALALPADGQQVTTEKG